MEPTIEPTMEPTIESNASLERPSQVARGLQLITASLVIGLVNAIFNLAQRVSGTSLVFALLVVVLFFGVGFLWINRISARRNWARIVWLVLVLFGTPFAILANVGEIRRNVLAGTLSIIVTLLQLLGTYLLFTKQSNLWFRTRK